MKPFKVSLKDFLGIRNEKWYLKFEFKMKKSKFLRYFLQEIFFKNRIEMSNQGTFHQVIKTLKNMGDHHRKCT